MSRRDVINNFNFNPAHLRVNTLLSVPVAVILKVKVEL